MEQAFQAAALAGAVGFFLLGIGILYTSYRILRSDPQSYRENQRLFGNEGILKALIRSFRGKASVCDGNSDYYRVHAGLGVDLKTGRLETQGRLSSEAARSVHEPIR